MYGGKVIQWKRLNDLDMKKDREKSRQHKEDNVKEARHSNNTLGAGLV